ACIMFTLLGVVCFLCKRRALSGRFPCGFAFGSHLLLPRVGPPSRSQCYDHRLYSGTHFLLLELHQAEMVSAVKYSYTSSITASCLASPFSNRSNCAWSSAIRLCKYCRSKCGAIGVTLNAIVVFLRPILPISESGAFAAAAHSMDEREVKPDLDGRASAPKLRLFARPS